jgi:hypothetical protein
LAVRRRERRCVDHTAAELLHEEILTCRLLVKDLI